MHSIAPIASKSGVDASQRHSSTPSGAASAFLDEALAGNLDAKAVLVTMTDGLENAGQEFDHAKITALIKDRQDKGWLITFLGEGLEVAK